MNNLQFVLYTQTQPGLSPPSDLTLILSSASLEDTRNKTKKMAVLRHKESIHSGQFMVSSFEAEDNDADDEVDLDVVSEVFKDQTKFQSVSTRFCTAALCKTRDKKIDDSLNKLFTCMSKVYAHKLSSPKWNRFLGLKLRWKDKIRLNNLIWRCWHMQFIGRKKKLMFDFVNPAEAGAPIKVEGGGTIMMGKYWKRRMDSVLAEYKKWRIYYKSHNTSIRSNVKKNNTAVDDIDLVSMISDADVFVNAIMADLGKRNDQENKVQ